MQFDRKKFLGGTVSQITAPEPSLEPRSPTSARREVPRRRIDKGADLRKLGQKENAQRSLAQDLRSPRAHLRAAAARARHHRHDPAGRLRARQ
jgi:hypothetical protein